VLAWHAVKKNDLAPEVREIQSFLGGKQHKIPLVSFIQINEKKPPAERKDRAEGFLPAMPRRARGTFCRKSDKDKP